jgi:hypothetical protein
MTAETITIQRTDRIEEIADFNRLAFLMSHAARILERYNDDEMFQTELAAVRGIQEMANETVDMFRD